MDSVVSAMGGADRRLERVGGWALAAIVLLTLAGVPPPARAGDLRAPAGFQIEVVATGLARPTDLGFGPDGTLFVLDRGWRGDAAGEIVRLDLTLPLPLDASRSVRLRIPFPEGPHKFSLGSLAVQPTTGALFLGEENGTRVYRLARDGTLTLYLVGLQRLSGGDTLAFDAQGRLLIVDFAGLPARPGEEPPPGEFAWLVNFDWLQDEAYKGPLIFRLEMDQAYPLPRTLESVPPLFPRDWGGRAGAWFPLFLSIAPAPTGDVLLLSAGGELFRLDGNGMLHRLIALPPGPYTHPAMVARPDGGVLVSAGFHLRRVFHVSPDGAISLILHDLADPEGMALDQTGRLYIAETAAHRILRVTFPHPFPAAGHP